MTIVVEDGSGLGDANSYVSVDDCAEYAAARGLTFVASPPVLAEQALVRATAALDATYRGAFPGYKTNGRSQALEWPRTGGYDADGDAIDSDEIPAEIIQACCEMAIREFATPGMMLPDLERGGQIEMVKAGVVAIQYSGNAPAQTTFTLIDGILSGILSGAAQSELTGSVVRG